LNRLAALILGCAVAHAAPAAASDLGNAAGAAAGIFAGIYAHEAGHALVLQAAGAEDIHIFVPGSQCKLLCGETRGRFASRRGPATLQTLAVAGFISSNLASELLLHNQGAARSGFGQGFVATNLYSNASHVFKYDTQIVGRNGYRGNDIDDYARAGGNPHLLSAGLIAYSVWTLHRMRKKEIPVMFVQLRF
jgi:hypothetical protein